MRGSVFHCSRLLPIFIVILVLSWKCSEQKFFVRNTFWKCFLQVCLFIFHYIICWPEFLFVLTFIKFKSCLLFLLLSMFSEFSLGNLCLPCEDSKSFIILTSTFRSKIHQILNFVWCEVGNWAHFFHHQQQVVSVPFVEKTFPFELLYQSLCQKINSRSTYMSLYSGLLHWSSLMPISNCVHYCNFILTLEGK